MPVDDLSDAAHIVVDVRLERKLPTWLGRYCRDFYHDDGGAEPSASVPLLVEGVVLDIVNHDVRRLEADWPILAHAGA